MKTGLHNSLIGNRYRLLDQLGEGGMATVYIAHDEKLQRKVAVKLLHPHFASNKDIRQRFELEATAISSMDHPNIVRVFDFSGPESSQLWIVTEILKGRNLAQFARGFKRSIVPPIVSVCIVQEICKALDHAHGKGIVHRDIKPENVMLLETGQIKLMDFGIAKNLHSSSLTMTGTFMGSPSYMSPEQIHGKNTDQRGDIYSLGVLFYELLTGRLPYTGQSTHDVVVKILEGKFTAPKFYVAELARTLDEMVCKAMSHAADDRFQSASAFSSELTSHLITCGFDESHVELERFCRDPQGYQQHRLATRAEPGARTTAPKMIDQSSVAATKAHASTRQVPVPARSFIPDPSVAQRNDAALAVPVTAMDPRLERLRSQIVSQGGRRDRKIPTQHLPSPPRPLQARSSLPPQQAPTQAAAQPVLLQAVVVPQQPTPKQKRRARPPMPRRSRTVNILVQRRYRVSGNSTSTSLMLAWMVIIALGAGLAILAWERHGKKPGVEAGRKQNVATRPTRPAGADKPQETPRADVRKRDPKKDQRPAKPPRRVAQTPIDRPRAPSTRTPPAPSPAASPTAPTRTPSDEKPATPELEFGFVRMSSRPSAQIFIDGAPSGTTTDATSHSGFKKITTGKHEIELRRPGYETHRQSIDVASDARIVIPSVTLKEDGSSIRFQVQVDAYPLPCQMSVTSADDGTTSTHRITSAPYAIELAPGNYKVILQQGKQRIERHLTLRRAQGGTGVIELNVNFERLR